MSDATTNLLLPFILAAQSQKHVTHNEALRALDGLVQMAVLDKDLTAPPGSPADGDAYIVAAGASGEWAGWDGDVALRTDGAWLRLVARVGWRAWVADEGAVYVRLAAGWVATVRSAAWDLAVAPQGAAVGVAVQEELLSGLSGATRDSSIQIPDRAILLGVSTRTVTTITGATSYDCGIVGEADKFGASLGVAAGSSNAGVIGPQAFYAGTPVRLTAVGGNFTGGAVRIALHYLTVKVPG